MRYWISKVKRFYGHSCTNSFLGTSQLFYYNDMSKGYITCKKKTSKVQCVYYIVPYVFVFIITFLYTYWIYYIKIMLLKYYS